jgi:hypothetical protein
MGGGGDGGLIARKTGLPTLFKIFRPARPKKIAITKNTRQFFESISGEKYSKVKRMENLS